MTVFVLKAKVFLKLAKIIMNSSPAWICSDLSLKHHKKSLKTPKKTTKTNNNLHFTLHFCPKWGLGRLSTNITSFSTFIFSYSHTDNHADLCKVLENMIYRTCGPVWRLVLCSIAEVIVISVIIALCAPYGLSGDRGWGLLKGTVIVTGWSLISVVVCPN